MKLYSDPATMALLQSGMPTVALYGKTQGDDFAFLGRLEGVLALHAAPQKERLVLMPLSRSGEGKPGEEMPLGTPPSGCVLLWSAHEEDLPEMEACVKNLNGVYARSRFAVGCGSAPSLESRLLALALSDTRTYAMRATQLNAALSQIRQEHELTRKVLHNMQDILWNIRGNPPRQTSFTKLGRGRIALDMLKKQGASGFSQRLLVQSKGLAGVDIYIADRCDAPGMMVCKLVAVSTGEVLAHWNSVYSDVEIGWLHLPLSTILAQNNLGLELQVTFVGPYNDSLTLGLTNEVVSGASYLNVGGATQQGKMLAMRTWGGFPGIRNESAKGREPQAENDAFFEYKLSSAQLRRLCLSVDHQVGFPCLHVDDEGIVLLHPLVNVEMSAYLPGGIPRGLRHVEAEVWVNGECPSRAEFAIAAVIPGTDPAHVTPDSKECVASSGWTPVSRNFSRELLGLTLQEPYLKGELDLYLFTRVPKDHSVDFCQAQFVQVKLGLDISKAQTVVESPSVQAYALPEAPKAPDDVLQLQESILHEAYELYDFELDFTSFKMMPPRGMMLHPVLNYLNVAVIPAAVPASTTAVIVDIAVGERCVEEVEFGVALPDAGFTLEEAQEFQPDDGRLSVKTETIGLKTMAATLTFELPQKTSAPTDLYLFTRLPANLNMDFTDSYFENIRFVVQ